jgi:hypothetical protein
MLVVAESLFKGNSFGRRPLMNATEAEVRRLGLWTDTDDVLSTSVGIKSRGLATIDYRFSDLARQGLLVAERRDTWRVAPGQLERIKSKSTRSSLNEDAAQPVIPHYLTRISYNSQGWRGPTRDAQSFEAEGTYNQQNGFGLEDWLFRDEWRIDGWRYAFIQGVNKSSDRLTREQTPFNVTLFTIDDKKRRRYVATIRAVECLTDTDAEAALDVFRQNQWLETMRTDIQKSGGNVEALDRDPRAKNILNVRFRVENIVPFPSDTYAQDDDPVFGLTRYNLNNLGAVAAKDNGKQKMRSGSETPPVQRPFLRKPSAAILCTPEHAKIQAKLVEDLRKEFPSARIVCEEDFVDVSVQTDNELILFEIKSDQEPRSVIRQALGQILEYAYHPNRQHSLPVQLVIVGRCQLTSFDTSYLTRLKADFGLPLTYRVVAI